MSAWTAQDGWGRVGVCLILLSCILLVFSPILVIIGIWSDLRLAYSAIGTLLASVVFALVGGTLLSD